MNPPRKRLKVRSGRRRVVPAPSAEALAAQAAQVAANMKSATDAAAAQALRQYQEAHPPRRIVVLEAASDAGGLATFTFDPAFPAPPDVTPRVKSSTPSGAFAEIVSVTKGKAVIRVSKVKTLSGAIGQVGAVFEPGAGVTVSLRAEEL